MANSIYTCRCVYFLPTLTDVTVSMKHFTLFAFFVSVCSIASAQQDPIYTKYVFNSLLYNPAVAGSNDHLTVSALHRAQWFNGGDGTPQTSIVSAHTPLLNNNTGIGLSLFNDRLGPTYQTGGQLSYAYRILFDKEAVRSLGIGLSASFYNWRSDWSELTARNWADPVFVDVNKQPNFWLYNFGFGLYFKSPSFFAGASVPRILETGLGDKGIVGNDNPAARQFRMAILTAGMTFKVAYNLEFKPYFVVRNVGALSNFKDSSGKSLGAPTTLDIDASFLYDDKLQVGAAYRAALETVQGKSSDDSIDFWVMYKIANIGKIGVAYDIPLSKYGQQNGGAVQITYVYEAFHVIKRVESPRIY